MAAGIYVGSTAGYSGKNILVMGMGLRWQREGHKIGYMKPVGPLVTERGGVQGDEDAFFVQEVLGLSDTPADVTPVLVSREFRVKALSGQCGDHMPRIKAAYDKMAQDRDVVLVAGSGSMHTGRYCNLDGIRVAKALGLKVVVVDRMHEDINYDFLVALRDELGDQMAGVVLNGIPPKFVDEVEVVIRPFLERNGVKVLGVLPKDPLMAAIQVGDMAEKLNGRVITCQSKADKVVENFIIGTMQVENFLSHFRKSRNSVVITGGDRSDVQLVALEGNCPCLLLTGNLYPNDIILTQSEIKEIPIVLVPEDTFTVAKKMEILLSRHKLRDVVKIKQGAQVVSTSVDFDYLKTQIGL